MSLRARLNIDVVEATKFRVLAIGLVAGFLILWLAGSFWVDAWSQYQQARRIQTLTIDNSELANASILNRSYESISNKEFSRLQAELYDQAHPTLTGLVPYVVAKQRIIEFENVAAAIQRNLRTQSSSLTRQSIERENLEVVLQRAIQATQLREKHQELNDFVNSFIHISEEVVKAEHLTILSNSFARASGKLLDEKIDNSTVKEDLSSLRSALVAIDTGTSQHILNVTKSVESHALRRILIDTLLIIICLWIGMSSQRLLGHIHNQAYYDQRTKLPNRFKLKNIMDSSLATLDTQNDCCALSIIEINNLDQINDSFGKEIGDKLLYLVGERFLKTAGSHASVACIGDNRFAVFFEFLNESENADKRTQNLLSCCEGGINIDGVTVHLGLSAGISYAPEHALISDELIRKSELAMVLAGKAGENQFLRFSDDLLEQHKARIQLEVDLRTAVKENQFSLYYQPKVCTRTGDVHSVEALIRWAHPSRGVVSPFHFISVAEQCGLIHDIGTWVLNEAIRQTVCWQRNGLEQLQVAVNVSVFQFLEDGFIEQVGEAVKRHALPKNSLELEITESVAMVDIEKVISGLTELKNAGIRIAIDDFGTDYSSLKILDDLPVDVLKIDRSFVNRLDHVDCERSLVNTIVHMARTLGLETVAEGVETELQLKKIQKLGCDYIQGYYYAKPVPADELLGTIYAIENRQASGNNRAA